ncbi:MAG TPA: hypothetical protein VG942_07830 [Hyphomonadaceae bacterium]|nr:hypothetical protein [Hyphomonadaceae bacterium]
MLLWMLFAFVAVAGLFPKSSVGRAVREALFGDADRPDAKLKLPKLHRALLVALILLAAGPAMPAEMALFFAGDLATYFEIIAATTLLGAVLNFRGAVRSIASLALKAARRVLAVARSGYRGIQRARRIKKPRAKPQKHEDEPGWAFV